MSAPVYGYLREGETTTEALARLGFRYQGRVGIGGNVMRISDGHIMVYVRNVEAATRWIRSACPDCDGKAMAEEYPPHTASDFEVAS